MPTEILNDYERLTIKSAMDLVIERATGGMNGEKYLAEIADIIDPDRVMTKEKRMVELYSMCESIKLKVK